MIRKIAFPYSLILSLLFPFLVTAQLAVSPVNVFIESQTGLGNLYVSNPGEIPREVRISFTFGYADYDTLGNLLMVYDDPQVAAVSDLGTFLRVFPRSFILGPQEQQTVRLQVMPLSGQPDGMYWTRVVITSSMAPEDLELSGLPESIGARINYVFRQNLPVFYGKKNLTTGIVVNKIRTSLKSDHAEILFSLSRTGNSPWNGTVTAHLLDAGGKIITTNKQNTVVYFHATRRIEFKYSEIPPNVMVRNLKLIFETIRNDIPVEDLVQAETLIHQEELNISIHR